jgi:RHS repeat-associated protein
VISYLLSSLRNRDFILKKGGFMKKILGLIFLAHLFSAVSAFATCADNYSNMATQINLCNGYSPQGCPNFYDRSYATQEVDAFGNLNAFCIKWYCNGGNPVQASKTSIAQIPASCRNGTATSSLPALNNEAPICRSGSIIQSENKTVGENISIAGASFSLSYFTQWVKGHANDYTIVSKLGGSGVRSQVSGYDVKVYNEIGTQVDHQTFAATTPEYDYTWNGLNSSSVETWGALKYQVVLTENASDFNSVITFYGVVGNLKSKKLGLGGWVPNIWNFYDVTSLTLIRGDGSLKKLPAAATVITGGYRLPEDGAGLVYYFDSLGRITQTKSGKTGTALYTFAYDSNGYLSTITEPFSKVTTFNRDSYGNLTSIVAPNGKTTNVTLDSNGYLATVTNPASEVFSMTYLSSGGLLQTFTKPNSSVSTMAYDSLGNLVSDTHSGGYSTTLGISGANLTLTSPMGRVTTSTSNDTGGTRNLTQTEPNSVVTASKISSTYVENSSRSFKVASYFGNDPRFGNLARAFTQKTVYDFGLRQSNFTNTVSLSNSLDPFSIITMTNKETLGSGTTAIEYTSTYTGSTGTISDSTKLGRTHTRTIDSYERPTSDQIGNLTTVNYTYTNDLLTQVQQGVRTTTFAYDSTTNWLTSITNPLSEVIQFGYDSAGRLTSKTLPDSRVINYVYDFQGNLTSITPPSKPVHLFTLNSRELLSAYQPPALDLINNYNTTYSYNNDNQLTLITRADGQTITYNYGSTNGKLTSITGSFGTYTPTFDGSGYLSQMVGPNNFSNYFYYNYNQPSSVNYYLSGSSLGSYSRTSNNFGQVTSDTVNGATGTRAISYTYDNDELVTVAGDISLAYNIPNGQLTGTTLSTLTDSYTYNSFGEVTAYTASNSGTAIYSYTLTRDNLGRITEKVETLNGVTSTFDYTYDSAGRLTQVNKNSVTIATYSYDSNSNRNGGAIGGVTTSASYDDQDRMTAYNVNTYTYNRNGELTSKYNTVSTQTTSYTYDVFGNLKQVVLPVKTINYDIDAIHQRIGRKNGSTLLGRYIYDANRRLIGELNSTNALTRRYIYASKKHVPDYFIDSAGEKYRMFSDNLGSIRLVVKLSTGTVMQLMEHDEFGRVVQDTSPGYQPFGFAGGIYDSDSGLVRFGTRDYDPETGRWTSKDPSLFSGGMNLFGYTNNDPINFIDSNGKNPVLVAVGIGAAVGAVANVTGSYAAGTLNRGNFLQTAGIGAFAGGAAVLTSGTAALATAGSLASILTAELGSGFIGTVAATGIDIGLTLLSNPPNPLPSAFPPKPKPVCQ